MWEDCKTMRKKEERKKKGSQGKGLMQLVLCSHYYHHMERYLIKCPYLSGDHHFVGSVGREQVVPALDKGDDVVRSCDTALATRTVTERVTHVLGLIHVKHVTLLVPSIWIVGKLNAHHMYAYKTNFNFKKQAMHMIFVFNNVVYLSEP
jgi:hypothetical protein